MFKNAVQSKELKNVFFLLHSIENNRHQTKNDLKNKIIKFLLIYNIIYRIYDFLLT